MKQSIIRGVMAGLAAAAGIVAVAAPAGAVTPTGSGTANSPFVAPCNEGPPKVWASCQVDFPPKTVKPLDSEQLDYYQCPPDHPYLYNKSYSPGTLIGRGIEIRGRAPFGIQADVAAGPRSEFAWVNNLPYTRTDGGTVTNWNTDPRDYGVTLRCTSDKISAYTPFSLIELNEG